MAGETSHWRLDMETFHGFRDERPKEEKWELIDGRPVMMPPPSLMHQRISGNLETLLNARLPAVRPEWRADREIGLLIPQDQKLRLRVNHSSHNFLAKTSRYPTILDQY